MAEQPIQMTPAELSATTLVRVASKCRACDGGEVGLTYDADGREIGRDHAYTCLLCDGTGLLCPYEVGDVLFHQEEWHSIYGPDHPIANDDPYMFYRANQDDPAAEVPGMDWYPTDTMPFWASRHRRTVTSVELVRLQEITEADWLVIYPPEYPAHGRFALLPEPELEWDDANPEHPWASNPVVWKIGVEGGEK